MAATGYTPIQLYYSTTASATPSAGNLLSGELAINITDGKLYYKDNAGAVQLLSTSTTANGTANGVLYLNGSKVATSGSALTFDGTTLTGTSATTAANLILNNTGASTQTYATLNSGATILGALLRPNTTNDIQLNANYGSLVWGIGSAGTASEAMRLTSTGLGIGTSSPQARIDFGSSTDQSFYLYNASSDRYGLDMKQYDSQGYGINVFAGNGGYVKLRTASGSSTPVTRLTVTPAGDVGIGTTSPTAFGAGYVTTTVYGSSAGIFQSKNAGGGDTRLYASGVDTLLGSWGTNGNVLIYANASLKATLDTSGNLGLGVTPSAWGLGKAFEVGAGGNGLWTVGNANIYLVSNTYYASGAYRYASTNAASAYEQENGAHKWRIAASGTAGDPISFTQAMTLDASGNLGIGTSSPSAKLDVAATIPQISLTGTSSSSTTYGALNFKAQTNTNWQIATNLAVGAGLEFNQGAASNNRMYLDTSGNLSLATNGTSFQWSNTGNNVAINATSGVLSFYTGTSSYSERARIDSSGSLLVGTTGQTLGTARLCVSSSGLTTVSTTSTSTESPYASFNTATSGNNQFMWFYTGDSGQTFRGSIEFNRAAGLVTYNTTSDYRAKDISGPVENSGALIDSVPVYMGKMKGATQERPMFIAHETPAYAHTGEKDAVDADGNPVYQQMDASALIPVMWAEIQSLRARVAALES